MTTGERIVAGYDGSQDSRMALQWAARQAVLTGATLEIVVAWHWPVSLGMTPLGDYSPEEDAKATAEEARKAIDMPGERVNVRICEGPSALRITEAAKDADLLVVGSRGHNAFTDLMLGSVSSYCAHHAPCPVVIVRPTES